MSGDIRELTRRDLLKSLAMAGLALGMSSRSRAAPGPTKETRMSRVFITGSTDGLGLLAARALMGPVNTT
jgi:uncharacterized protein (DUF1501 family)